jgi:1,4-dihydroxy-2-naphthoate octaprenyltransferase
VLNINNIRDIESDTTAGKKSIPVRIGRKAANIYNWFLILGGNYCLLIFAFVTKEWTTLLALALFPLMIRIGISVQKGKDSEAIDPNLKKMALSTLVWVILFGIGLVFLGKS